MEKNLARRWTSSPHLHITTDSRTSCFFLWIINRYSGNEHPLLNWDSNSRLELIPHKESQSKNYVQLCPAAILDCWVVSIQSPQPSHRLRKRFGDPRERDRWSTDMVTTGDPPFKAPPASPINSAMLQSPSKDGDTSHRHTSNAFTSGGDDPQWLLIRKIEGGARRYYSPNVMFVGV